MANLTVTYKFKGKVYIGILKDSRVDYFDRLMVSTKEFRDNIFYLMMVDDDSSEISEVDMVPYDFSTIIEEEDFIVLANNALSLFKRNVTFH